MKKLKAASALGLGLMASVGAMVATAVPAQAGSYDCSAYISNNRPVIYCRQISGLEARTRADCAWAPDVYTRWISTAGVTATGGPCVVPARGAILNIR